MLASPYEVVVRSGDEERDHRRLLEIAEEVEAERIVVGLPLSLDGTMGPTAVAYAAEAERLGATTTLPVETYDERLTTVTADRSLMERKHEGRRPAPDHRQGRRRGHAAGLARRPAPSRRERVSAACPPTT